MFGMLGRGHRPAGRAGGRAPVEKHPAMAHDRSVASGWSGHPSGNTAFPLVIDVRPLVAAGQEPFETIMVAVAQLRGDQPLVVKAPFEPVPLVGVLSEKGFSYSAEHLPGGDWKVRFTRPIPGR